MALVLVPALLTSLLLVRPAHGSSDTVVRITSGLDPAEVTVGVGAVVTWVNEDTERHRVRGTDSDLDSGNLEPGERFSWTFSIEGTFRYHDDRQRDDPAYHGVVRVVSSPSPSPPSPSGPEPTPTGSPATQPAAGPAAPSSAAVGMRNRVFSPREVTIAEGATVSWRNDDDREHTVTGDAFDSGVMTAGARYDRTFPAAGRFSYLCLIHPDMTGVVVVVSSGASGPPPSSGSEPAADSPSQPASGPSPTPSDQPTGGDGTSGGSASAPPPSTGSTSTVAGRGDVNVVDFAFAPSRIEVASGGTIRFTNTGRAPHTVTASDGTFDSGILTSGGSFTRRFPVAGTFGFVCTLHPEMTGTVVVRGVDATASGRTSVLSGGAVPPDGLAGTSVQEAGSASPDATVGADAGAADAGAPSTDVAAYRLAIVDNAFEPSVLEVEAGAEVTWSNDGDAPHTVTARDGSFDSGVLIAGQTWTSTFDEPGDYAYTCLVHPDMVATLRVVDPAAELADGPPPPVGQATGAGSGPPSWVLQMAMVALFVLGLAAFTVASGRVASLDRP